MNFSNTCRLKKGLSLILIVLMVVGMFSGCKKNNSETESNTTPSLNLNMSDTSAPTQETVPPTTTEPIVYNENMGTVTNQISVRVIPARTPTSPAPWTPVPWWRFSVRRPLPRSPGA